MADTQRPDKITMAPKPSSGNKRLLWILLICAVAAGAFWMFRDSARELTRPAPPPVDQGQMRLQLPTPPQTTVNGTANATSQSAGAAMSGGETSAAAVTGNAVSAQTAETATGEAQNVGRVMPKVQDDSVITLSFVSDLARYLADSYYPAGTEAAKKEDTGVLVTGTKALNMHYGVEMTGLTWSGDDIRKGRQSILRYVLTPTMTDALYNLYADRFMAALQEEARQIIRNVEGEERNLTRMEIKEMHHLLSTKVQATAGVLRACVLMEDAMAKVEALHASTKKSLEANQQFQTALLRYQELSEADAKDAKAIAKAKTAMDSAGKTYQQAIMQRERTRESLANALRKYKWVSMQDDGTNVYIAQWVYRRVQDNPRVFPAIMSMHENLLDLAERMEKKAAL